MRAIVSTTINVPGNLSHWRQAMSDDDVVIVTGDQKSPHDDIRAFMGDLPGKNIYLSPEEQTHWASSEPTGWNCIQRRNIATLEALRYEPEFIVSIDDDNYPLTALQMVQYDNLFKGFDVPPQVKARGGWFNPGTACSPPVVHRGFPLWLRKEYEQAELSMFYPPVNVGVIASLWIGDPDIDAIERMFHDPEVTGVSFPSFSLRKGTWGPFNSQATAIRGDLAPLFMMWPGVGRYDDIWASYLMRAIMDVRNDVVVYGEPLVRQVRNEHDLLKDLEAEMFGMRHNAAVVQVLRQVTSHLTSEMTVIDSLATAWSELSHLPFIPEETKKAWDAWMIDLHSLDLA